MDGNHYHCTAKDCSLRFPSEDSLQLHKKKHEMVLTLNKSSIPSADQTPTPVRFIRQCEEIGLFQDLQNVNPFEETFRKAAEAVKKGSVPKQPNASILSHVACDELHTPHIFPDEINLESNIEGNKNLNQRGPEEVVIRTEADTSLKPSNAQQLQSPPSSNDRVSTTVNGIDPIIKNNRCLINGIDNEESIIRISPAPAFSSTFVSDNGFNDAVADPVQVLLRMPNGSLVQLATKPVTAPIVPLNIAPPASQIEESVKVFPRSCTNGATVILATHGLQKSSETVQSHQLTTKDVKQKLKQLLGGAAKTAKQPTTIQKNITAANRSETTTKKVNRADNDLTDDTEKEKRRSILERNRKAAIRSRERRKRWVEELRKRADATAATNKALNDEIRCLKAENASLRTILLAHANCPITLTQTSTPEIADITISNENIEVTRSGKRPRRDGLTLDIEQASRAAVAITTIDLDTPTPTIVRNDKILSSVAPPATPEQDRLVAFTDILSHEQGSEISEEMIEDRHLTSSSSISSGTTVIQINPNALRLSHAFS